MEYALFAANDPKLPVNLDWWMLLLGGIVFLFLLLSLIVFFSFVRLWIQCLLTGAKISILDLVGMKLRKLLNYSEPLGDFLAFVPGERRQQTWPSTVAYLAQLLIHRYAMLGVLDESGYPRREMGVLEAPRDERAPKVMQGALCSECGNYTVIRRDGCDFCTACGAVGACG